MADDGRDFNTGIVVTREARPARPGADVKHQRRDVAVKLPPYSGEEGEGAAGHNAHCQEATKTRRAIPTRARAVNLVKGTWAEEGGREIHRIAGDRSTLQTSTYTPRLNGTPRGGARAATATTAAAATTTAATAANADTAATNAVSRRIL